MKTLSNYISEKLIIYPKQVSEKLIINKDYKKYSIFEQSDKAFYLMICLTGSSTILCVNVINIEKITNNLEITYSFKHERHEFYSSEGQITREYLESKNSDILYLDTYNNFIEILLPFKLRKNFEDLINDFIVIRKMFGKKAMVSFKEVLKMLDIDQDMFNDFGASSVELMESLNDLEKIKEYINK